MSVINQLNATTEVYWNNIEPVDIVSKASALLWKLMGNAISGESWLVKGHEIVDGGRMIKVPLKYSTSNHGAYGANTVINQSKKDIIDAARFRWAGAYGSNTKNLEDLTANSGAEAIIDLTKAYIESIQQAIRIDMASQIIAAATDTDHINGLLDLFDTTGSTEYGSIAEDDMSDWKANVIATAEAISFEVMQKIFRTPAMGGHDMYKPDFVVTTDKLRDGYERSLHPQQRYTNTSMVEAGWQNITHKGAPIVSDAYVTDSYDGYLFALNLRFLKLKTHKDYNFTVPKWASKEVLGQPDVMSANTRWRGNLVCENRKLQIMHTGLTEPV